MIKITNGSRTTVVTMGAYKEVYAPMGWKIVDGTSEVKKPAKKEKPVIAVPEPEEVVEEKVEEPEEVEIPISEMRLDELKQYAADHGVDISAAKTKQDIKAIIKAEMEE